MGFLIDSPKYGVKSVLYVPTHAEDCRDKSKYQACIRINGKQYISASGKYHKKFRRVS